MFFWPDSIPPGAEYAILVIAPLGLVVAAKAPLLALLQLGILAFLAYATCSIVRAKDWPRSSLAILLPIAYICGTFVSNIGVLLLH